MKHVLFIVVISAVAAGCSPYTRAQMDLVTQARRGVALVAASDEAHVGHLEALYAARRARLDEAFDADIREAKTLSPEWVVEHRKAYAVGVDGLHRQHAASVAAEEVRRRNLRAVDHALERLGWLQSIQFRLSEQLSLKETP